MTDTTQLLQVVNQLATMGKTFTESMTPYALEAAQLDAKVGYSQWEMLGWITGGMGLFFVILLASFIFFNDSDGFIRPLLTVFSGIIFAVCLFFSVIFYPVAQVDKYGINHPAAYLAYTTFESMTGN